MPLPYREGSINNYSDAYVNEIVNVVGEVFLDGCVGCVQTENILVSGFDCLQSALDVLGVFLRLSTATTNNPFQLISTGELIQYTQ